MSEKHDSPQPQPVSLKLTPMEVATRLQHLPNMVFFDTAGNLPSRSAAPISIIAARPTEILQGNIHNAQDIETLRTAIQRYPSHLPSSGFPTGGACGWIDYDGAFTFGMYPEMLIYLHDQQQWWQCGQLTEAFQKKNGIAPNSPSNTPPTISNFHATSTQEDFESGVRRIHEYIAAGDIYQVNLTQQFSADISGGSLFPLYQKLRTSTPAPVAMWAQLDQREILSSSPETFLRISGKHIETRPI